MHISAQRGIAIIGSGVAGLACARRLNAAGHRVSVFDKGRHPGGRLASRALLFAGQRWWFDHGAQYFTARTPEFQAETAVGLATGALAPWTGSIETIASTDSAHGQAPRLIGQPRMHRWAAFLAEGLSLHQEVEITHLEHRAMGYRLHTASGALPGLFAQVVIAIPAAQATALLTPVAPALAARAEQASLAPCWALMGVFADAEAPFEGIRPAQDSPLAWARRNASPVMTESHTPSAHRNASPVSTAESPTAWVLHARPDWSLAHLAVSPEAVTRKMLAAWSAVPGMARARCLHATVHRWRYALVDAALGEPCLWDAARGLGTCGDWHLGPRVELAWTSGNALGEAMLAHPSGA